MKKELSIIIPAYNEGRKITGTLRQTAEYLSNHAYVFEIIVVNDGSTDQTAVQVIEISKEYPQIKLINNQINVGKGKAIREGVQNAQYERCLFMDADNSTTIQEWSKFEDFFDEGFQAVIASRHMPDSQILRPQPWKRRVLGGGYRGLCRFLFGIKVTDFNCGFKAYATPIAKKIYSSTLMNDWTFDVEVLCRLKKEGIVPAEVPVAWQHEEKASHASLFQTVKNTLHSIIKLKRLLAS